MSMLQASQRDVTADLRRGAGLRRARWIVLLLLALVLVGCADDEGGRQFANDPRTPLPSATSGPKPTGPAESPHRPRSHVSPEALVDRRGAPVAAWWLVDGAVWTFGGAQPREVVSHGALACAAAPDGTAAAVVTASGGSYRIDIYDTAGRRTKTLDDVLPVSAAGASPAAVGTGVAPAVTLDWSPQGNRLLLGDRSGALVDVPLDGESERIETRAPLAGIDRAAWSPRGDVIAVLTRDREGVGSIALIDPQTRPASVSVVAPIGGRDDGAMSVEAFDWKPRGDGIVFIEAKRGSRGPAGGQVVAWDRATNAMQILATGAQGGPTGSVTWLSVAPDGKAVAYIVMVQGGDVPSFVGLFVRSLINGQLYQVPVDADATVLQAWWLKDGLAWASDIGEPGAAREARLVAIDEHGERAVLGTIAPPAGATPGASPAASPVASPGASPVVPPPASPAAVAGASPDASPEASPAT